ncbi:hypothetical protein FHS01_002713 [Longimicrobium terrae]|uniref:Uncharacterized protein n=1 Tax=Longimicrobium terrae TaxID=1639882 RepID=A0A841H053_9BACT|nr:hypothetical protein [Longimicrobium terrae]MBB6071309.1 hypothetical protein [Longimicrobium terrae]
MDGKAPDAALASGAFLCGGGMRMIGLTVCVTSHSCVRTVWPSPRVLRTTTLSHERMWEREHTPVRWGNGFGARSRACVRRLKPRLEEHEVRLRGLRPTRCVFLMQLKPRTAPVGNVSGVPASGAADSFAQDTVRGANFRLPH